MIIRKPKPGEVVDTRLLLATLSHLIAMNKAGDYGPDNPMGHHDKYVAEAVKRAKEELFDEEMENARDAQV